MADPDTELEELETLADEFTERLRRGENPPVTEYVEKYPALAEEIRELFPTIAAMERLKVHKEHAGTGKASLGAAQLDRLGDFRIIREIGRGGMGIVYEAEQESLGRPVAIKVLPRQALLDTKHLRRFKREARIAANLHHTNIVEVFGVGEDEGFHYYVMQYIHGAGLDKIVSRLARADREDLARAQTERSDPTEPATGHAGQLRNVVHQFLDQPTEPVEAPHVAPTAKEPVPRSASTERSAPPPVLASSVGREHWRDVARIGLQVADALQYAHSQGTLHRDIKPANLLVDDAGVVWVTDFGLAKAVQSDDVTQSGDITGTLRYMAPEQFDGRADARSDIYSLGLTLYELLTLQPAFDDTNRSNLIRKITHTSPTPPRRLNPAIPRDLETAILKAMARDPDRRYQSAGDLGADLQSFLEDRPIQARRASAVERLWRWCRRNPAVASLASATLLLLVMIAIVATVGYVRTTNALEGEATERGRAEANAKLAIEALDRIFERFSPNPVMRVSALTVEGAENATIEVTTPPVLSKETAALLEDLLAFYDRLAKQGGDEAELRHKAAEANRRVGDIRQRLGQYAQAISAYRRAIITYHKDAEQPEGSKCLLETAKIHNELGGVYRLTQQTARARAEHAMALEVLQACSSGSAVPPAIRYELAHTHYLLGTRERPAPGSEPPAPAPGPGHRGHGRPPHPGVGPPPGLPGPPRPGAPPDSRHRVPGEDPPGHGEGVGAQPSPEQQAESGHLKKAIALLAELVQQHPTNPSYRHLLALCHRERSPQLTPHGRDAALEALNQATEILTKLVEDFPHVPDYRYDLCETYAMLDVRGHLRSPDSSAVAERNFRKALAISEKLVAENPYIPHYLASQAHIYHKLGAILERTRRPQEAEQCYRKCSSVQSSLVSQFPDVPSYKLWLAQFRRTLAGSLLRRDELAEARALLEETTTMLSDLVAGDPSLWYVHGLLTESYSALAVVLRRNGEDPLAAQATRRAEEHRKKMHENMPHDRPPRPQAPR